MGSVVVDASVVLGVLDGKDAHHVASVEALRSARIEGHKVVLPASALAEVLVGARRLGPPAVERTEAFVDTVLDSVHPIDRRLARKAAELRARHRTIRLPDALVIAAGEAIDGDRVLTADARWRKVDRRVQVVR